MAVSLDTLIRLKVDALLQSGITGVNGGEQLGLLDETIQLTSGTSTGQADRAYYAQRQLGTSANETLDLAGVLEDVYGNVLTFATVKLIAVKNVNTLAANLEFGPNSANGTGTSAAAPWKAAANKNLIPINGGMFLVWSPAGWAVTAGTADLLYAENMNGSNTLDYRILIIGTSA